MEDDALKQEREEENKKKSKMTRIARVKYMEEKEALQKKSQTSFGKLILADEKTSPQFSFGQGQRFTDTADLIKQGRSLPGPIYEVSDKYKFKAPSKWKIGTGNRPGIYSSEKFDYFDHVYDENFDLSKNPKKWNKTKGGAISLEPRIKFDFREGTPGPGRYEPDLKIIKQKAPSYYLGEKNNATSSLNLQIGTNDIVGPGSYAVEQSKNTSKHQDLPAWTIGKDKRKGLNYKTWTKNETYHVYSSVGTQIMTQKKSEPKLSIGKSERDKQVKLGMFPSMMSKQPTRISLPHPKI